MTALSRLLDLLIEPGIILPSIILALLALCLAYLFRRVAIPKLAGPEYDYRIWVANSDNFEGIADAIASSEHADGELTLFAPFASALRERLAKALESFPTNAKLCFLEKASTPQIEGGWKDTRTLATITGARSITVHGIYGAPLIKGEPVVFLLDVLGNGAQLNRAIDLLETLWGVRVAGAVALIDREEPISNELVARRLKMAVVLQWSLLRNGILKAGQRVEGVSFLDTTKRAMQPVHAPGAPEPAPATGV